PSTRALIPTWDPPPLRLILISGLRLRNASLAFCATGSSVVEPTITIWFEGAGVGDEAVLAASLGPQPSNSAVIIDIDASTSNFFIWFSCFHCDFRKSVKSVE